MPVLRSQRSKPSKRRVEEEMAPPEVEASPPKTRATRTRSKKVSKKEEVDVSDVPKSPTPSSSSTRSTRTRTRAKAVPVEVEEIEIESPPKTRTRSTRQKTAASKTSKSSAKIEKEKGLVDTASASGSAAVAPTPLATETKEKKTTAKKAKAKPRKAKKQLETASEDVTEDESDMEPKERKLTLRQLHKNYVAPLKTVMDGAICEVFPQATAIIMDKKLAKEQEKQFEQLMSCTSLEMPPPAAPASKKPKGKGRQKRARSPEKTPVKTKVPESFNFAVNKAEDHTPATKKIIMDAPTPTPTPESEENIFEQSVMEVDADMVESAEVEAESSADKFPKTEVVQDSQVKEVADLERGQNGEINTKPISDSDDDVKTKPLGKKDADAKVKTKPIKPDDDVKTKPLGKKDADVKTKPVSKPDDHESTKPLSKVSEIETKPLSKPNDKIEIKPLKKQDAKIKTQTLSKPNDEIEIKSFKKQDTEIQNKPLQKQDTENSSQDGKKKTTVASEKKSVVLDETYVFETPKDDKKEKEIKLNSTFTPELFVETPKSRVAETDKTIVISKPTAKDNTDELVLEDSILAPESPEPESTSDAPSSANGIVSSLVRLFDKTKQDLGNKISKTPSKTDNAELDKTTTVPSKIDSAEKVSTDNNDDLNSTYVLPSVKKTNLSSMMNVTVCVKKASTSEDEKDNHVGLQPIVPPASLLSQSNNSRFMHDSAASRTFVKEPPLAVVMEEDDEIKDGPKLTTTSEKTKPGANPKLAQKEKESSSSKKGVSSSSSSSSCSSMKSAISQPCLLSSSKKPPTGLSKSGPNYGSAGKLNEVNKSKPLEEAEKRRQELMQLKVENAKKKREEWAKKTEKNKMEEERRLKEKQKIIQPISNAAILKKPAPMALGNSGPEGGVGPSGFPKPKFNFGPSTSKMTNQATNLPPLSKNPFHSKPPSNEVDMDESFKSAHAGNSFLDQTTEGHLSSYDITVYEDLDEDLKHRENKTMPSWASDKEALKTALFSMVLLPDYQHNLTGGFPRPDKTYKLFPSTRIGHH